MFLRGHLTKENGMEWASSHMLMVSNAYHLVHRSLVTILQLLGAITLTPSVTIVVSARAHRQCIYRNVSSG